MRWFRFVFIVILFIESISALSIEDIAKLYVANFNRAGDSAGLNYWRDSGMPIESIAKSFYDQPETQNLYGNLSDNGAYIKAVYHNLFNREPDSAGYEYWLKELDSGNISKETFILAVINGALDDDAVILNNKTKVAMEYYKRDLNDITLAKEVMKNIDSSDSSVDSAISLIENTKDDSILSNRWPKYFFITAMKAYNLTKQEGIDTHSYAYGARVYKDFRDDEVEAWNEAVKRSNSEDDFIIFINYESIFRDRKNYTNTLQDVDTLKQYFNDYITTLKKLSVAKGHIVMNFSADPLAYFTGDIRKNYGNDPHNVPAKIHESGIIEQEGLSSDIPDNFAGFWQVFDQLRYKYVPNLNLAYTIKTWGIGVDPSKEPEGGWKSTSDGAKEIVEYLNNFGVAWDAVAFNYNPGKVTDDETMLKMARFFGAVSDGVVNDKTGQRVRTFIWKTKIVPQHYLKDESEWSYKSLSFEMRHIEDLADLGYAGINLGYGNELVGSKKSWPKEWKDKPLQLPDILHCWLVEYFDGVEGDCNPTATIGRVLIR